MITRTWLLVVAAAAIASFAAGWIVNGWRHNASEKAAVEAAIARTKSEYAKRDSDFAELQMRDQAASLENAKLRQQIIAQAVALQDAVRGLSLVQSKVTRNEDGTCECSDTRRGTTYRVCVNAALSGDAGAIATCEARRGHATVSRE